MATGWVSLAGPIFIQSSEEEGGEARPTHTRSLPGAAVPQDRPLKCTSRSSASDADGVNTGAAGEAAPPALKRVRSDSAAAAAASGAAAATAATPGAAAAAAAVLYQRIRGENGVGGSGSGERTAAAADPGPSRSGSPRPASAGSHQVEPLWELPPPPAGVLTNRTPGFHNVRPSPVLF